MRNLSAVERAVIETNTCPFCGASEWLEGPSGGASTNFQCEGCGARYNLAFGGGSLFLAELIREPLPGSIIVPNPKVLLPSRTAQLGAQLVPAPVPNMPAWFAWRWYFVALACVLGMLVGWWIA